MGAKTDGEALEAIHFIMEATGIYHEALAYALYQAGAKVSVVNPAQVRDYAKSLGSRNKTDQQDRMVLARYGATQTPRLWQPEPEAVRRLKALIGRIHAIESVRGRPRLSKAGNAALRAKLYMAAVACIQHNPDIERQYQRLLDNRKTKMSALCAAMRKLVHICFGVLKHQIPYQVQVL